MPLDSDTSGPEMVKANKAEAQKKQYTRVRLRHRAGRDVQMDVGVLEEFRVDAQPGGVGPHPAPRLRFSQL